MALFKFLKGNSANLPTTSTAGWVYVTEDTHDMYIFKTDSEKFQLNANYANALRVADNGALYGIGTKTSPVFFLDGVPSECALWEKYVTLDTDQTITGVKTFSNPIIQGAPNTSTTLNGMNKFKADLFVEGSGVATNTPSVPGFYLGKSQTDENRHMDIVSGGDYSYIDFNKASRGVDYDVRLLVNVTNGLTTLEWGSSSDLSQKVFDVKGAVTATSFTGPLYGNATSATSATNATNATNIYSVASTAKAYVLGTPTASSGNHNTVYNASVYTLGSVLYGACWNDYAEYRAQSEKVEPGYCVASADNGKVYKTTEKFQACDGIVSDTFGFVIGEKENNETPLAVAGRVLAYCEGDRYDYHSGDTVCAGPNGKVCKMTREEIREWPDRIIGIVSEIPEYETWGSGNVPVNGRIWIKVR